MNIGERIRVLREARELTQGDIEKRTLLKRSYISRVENGHTVPSIETLEKIARSLEIAMYQFFYEGNKPVDEGSIAQRAASLYGCSGKELFVLDKFRKLLAHMEDRDRKLLLVMAERMVKERGGKKGTKHGKSAGVPAEPASTDSLQNDLLSADTAPG